MNVRVRPGPGLVARTGTGVLVVLPGAEDLMADQLVAVLAQVCTGDPMPGRRLARVLAGLIFTVEDAEVPSFAAAAPTEDGWAVFVFGEAEALLDTGERWSGRDAATWVDRVIHAEFGWLALGAEGAGADGVERRSNLEAGVVPGAGAVVDLADGGDHTVAMPSMRAAPPVPTAAAPVSDEPLPFTPIPLVPLEPPDPAEEPPRPPLPIAGAEDAGTGADAGEGERVDGILCERGHFNHPDARWCSDCGVSTVNRAHTPVRRPRPSLGVVVSDEGRTYSLDHDYVVGRAPDQDPAVRSGQARTLRLEDPGRSVSRVHADIRLVGWDVQIVDRGSANGTFVAEEADAPWTRLAPDEPQAVRPGTRIAFGRRVLTYSTHHQTEGGS